MPSKVIARGSSQFSRWANRRLRTLALLQMDPCRTNPTRTSCPYSIAKDRLAPKETCRGSQMETRRRTFWRSRTWRGGRCSLAISPLCSTDKDFSTILQSHWTRRCGLICPLRFCIGVWGRLVWRCTTSSNMLGALRAMSNPSHQT